MSKEFLKMQKLAGLITESHFKQLVENDSIDIDTEYNEVILNSDSGEYTSEIKEDGSLTFELIFDDEGDIAYMNDKDIWDDFAPEIFKKIANADGDWYVDGDTVGVSTTLDKLKELFPSENSINENEQPKIGDKVDVFNPKGKYSKESWWGPDEYLHAEVVKINGQKITVKDINDDEYEVDLTDVSL
jgi:hypothetical protein